MDKILFSPIGGTDPISSTNLHDGSMLHIVRWEKPDKIILYMSKEMIDFQEKDDRYRYCLNKLFEQQGRENVVIDEIKRPNLADVQDFDFFYDEFRGIISEIMSSMTEDDELLINISSGTPAMKSGLLVLLTMGEFPAKAIQVVTPTRSLNEHQHRDYDNEVLWEFNEDNIEGSENRCKEVTCPSLSVYKNEQIIKKLVKEYDYQAAVIVAKSMPEDTTMNYLPYLRLAEARLALDFSTVDSLIRETGYDCLAVRASNGRKYYEYALALEVKRKRGEFGDFIRAISPIISDLFKMAVKNQCDIDISDYTYIGANGEIRWSQSALAGTQLLNILNSGYSNGFQYGFVRSDHYRQIITSLSGSNSRLIELTEKLRSVEEKIRNTAAHAIVSMNDSLIEEKSGFTSNRIIQMIRQYFSYTGTNVRSDQWNAYDEMNNYIIDKIDRRM